MASIIFVALSVMVLFCLSYAANSDIDTGACVFDKYHIDHELKSIEKIRPLFGKMYTSQNVQDGWSFTVGICASLKIDGADSDAAATQLKITEDGDRDPDDPKVHTIGSLKDTHIMTGRDWALLEYKGGETYGSHCGQEPKRAVIMLSCDETIGDGDAKMVHVEEESKKDEGCYYLFEMKHKALCPTASGSVLSIGSIFLITLFSVLVLYLIVGFIYQRFVLGSKGLEQIPNYEFWKDLGNLQADGCDFVCRTKGRQNTGFRGIGDDQLDATEEIRDDNLLPM